MRILLDGKDAFSVVNGRSSIQSAKKAYLKRHTKNSTGGVCGAGRGKRENSVNEHEENKMEKQEMFSRNFPLSYKENESSHGGYLEQQHEMKIRMPWWR